jgi:DNA-directed RNA polymerase specialized sigma24 family protein
MLRGVPLSEVRAAVALARLYCDGDGVTWTPEQWERVWKLLTPQQQRIVYLHLLVGCTHTSVAEQLGCTRGSVDAAWRRALQRIRPALRVLADVDLPV